MKRTLKGINSVPLLCWSVVSIAEGHFKGLMAHDLPHCHKVNPCHYRMRCAGMALECETLHSLAWGSLHCVLKLPNKVVEGFIGGYAGKDILRIQSACD